MWKTTLNTLRVHLNENRECTTERNSCPLKQFQTTPNLPHIYTYDSFLQTYIHKCLIHKFHIMLYGAWPFKSYNNFNRFYSFWTDLVILSCCPLSSYRAPFLSGWLSSRYWGCYCLWNLLVLVHDAPEEVFKAWDSSLLGGLVSSRGWLISSGGRLSTT